MADKSQHDGKNGTPVDKVIDTYADDIRDLAIRLRRLVLDTVPDVTEAVKWGNPVFEYRGKGLCYVQGHKDYLRFGFFEQGVGLNDPDGLLEGTGKAMRHVKVRTDEEIRPIFQDWLRQAAEMIDNR